MKLYRVPVCNGFVWYGTQVDAKLGAKQFNASFEQIDVPTDKNGLLSWLNDNPPEIGRGDLLEQAEQCAVAAASSSQPLTNHITTLTDAEEFIQNAPAAPELARIVDNVCWRLKELTSGASVPQVDEG